MDATRSPVPVAPPAEGTSHVNVHEVERIVSAAAGGLLAAYGLTRGSLGGAALAALGSVLVYRGASGHCPGYAALGVDTAGYDANAWAVEVHASVTVNAPRQEVYARWRELERLPTFMEHVESVVDLGAGRSRWRARAPKGLGRIEWDAEIVEDRKGEALAWRSLPGADVDNAGVVRFEDAPGDRGTEVHARIAYRPPAGALGGAVARWMDPVLSQTVKEDVRRFKRLIETGEVPTIEGQSSGRDD